MMTRPMLRAMQSKLLFAHKLLVLVLLLAVGVWAQMGAFTATYQATSTTPTDNGVQVTLSVQVTNNSAADVTNGTLSLANPAANRSYGAQPGVSIPAGGNSVVSITATVPQGVYDSWQAGNQLFFNLDYVDGNGKSIHQVFAATL